MSQTLDARLATLLDCAAEGIGALLGAACVLSNLGSPRVAAAMREHADALTEAVIAVNAAATSKEGTPE